MSDDPPPKNGSVVVRVLANISLGLKAVGPAAAFIVLVLCITAVAIWAPNQQGVILLFGILAGTLVVSLGARK